MPDKGFQRLEEIFYRKRNWTAVINYETIVWVIIKGGLHYDKTIRQPSLGKRQIFHRTGTDKI
ncbi:hypothetical protein, partial [Syntrophaceticus schinkii]|uniref:hypothetical protein n=1 Tax=Syntrophaceticus schinkii TaxID=499207 RepID=UPI0005CC8F61